MDETGRRAQEDRGAETGHFSAILRPNRSLGPNGFLALMIFFGGVSFITGMAFLMMGAWPVLGFFGLDVLILYIAFRLNYRDGRAFETVDIRPEALTIQRVGADGRSQSFDFNPYWVRVLTEAEPSGRVTLRLVSHGRSLTIAGMLSDEERLEFATALNTALDRLKMPRFGAD